MPCFFFPTPSTSLSQSFAVHCFFTHQRRWAKHQLLLRPPTHRPCSDVSCSFRRAIVEQGSRHRAALTDLAFELAGLSAGFRRSLPPAIQPPLASLVRAMNYYDSNLIEGHDTHRGAPVLMSNETGALHVALF